MIVHVPEANENDATQCFAGEQLPFASVTHG